jgi:hypothetical protein
MRGHLLVYVDLCAQPCCGFGPAPDGPVIAMLAARIDEGADAPGIFAFRSPDGAHWTRHPLRGVTPKDGSGSNLLFAREPGYPSHGLLAFRDGKQQAVMRSRDGLRWQRFGRAPQGVDTYGQLEMASVAGGVVLVGESYRADPGYGNEMRIWRLERSGVTRLTMVRRPAFANGLLVSGDRVLVLGSAWGPGQGPDGEAEESWAWIIGSQDGGRTWDPALAWTGSDGSCLGSTAQQDVSVISLACRRDEFREVEPGPGVWVAPIPAETSPPSTAAESPPPLTPSPTD